MKKRDFITSLLLLLFFIAAGGEHLASYLHHIDGHNHCCHHEHHHSGEQIASCCKVCHISEQVEFQCTAAIPLPSAPTKSSTILLLLCLGGTCAIAFRLYAHSSPKYEDHSTWHILNQFLSSQLSLRAPPVLS